MSKKPTIKDLPTRTFWTECPRKLDRYPTATCKMGCASSKAKPEDVSCDWFIKSKEAKYCFWVYVKQNSFPNGKMQALHQATIAELENCSATKIHFTLREAFKKLKNHEYADILREYLSGTSESTLDTGIGAFSDDGDDSTEK